MIITKEKSHKIDFEGIRIYDYTFNVEISSSFAFLEVPPGVKHKTAYSKRSNKYYFVISGKLDIFFNGEEHKLKKNDFWYVRKGTKFSYTNKSSETAVIILFHNPKFNLEAEVFVDNE